MGAPDFPIIASMQDQRRELYARRILNSFPDRVNDPIIQFGDIELEYIRLLNDGLIYDGEPTVLDATVAARINDAASQTRTALKNTFVEKTDLPINVMDYGAVGDGVTDDRLAIQNALTAAGAGGTVYFPDKVFLVATATQPVSGNTGRILVVYPNQTLIGASRNKTTIKVANSFGGYYAMLGGVTEATDMGQIRISGIKFDQNNTNGNVYNSSEASTYPRHVVRMLSFTAGSSFVAKDCIFANSDSMNTLYVGFETIDISNNLFRGTGVPGGTTFHDHSSIYASTTVDGGLQTINSNIFRGNLGSGSSVCAIETHGGTQTIVGNNIYGYQIGANLTGWDTIRNQAITFAGNSITKCVFGIQLWSRYTATVTTGAALNDVVLDHNNIIIDRDSWLGITGLSATAWGITVDEASTAPIQGLIISNNFIKYLTINATGITNDSKSNGIRLVTANAACTINDAEIVNNKILYPISSGMHLSSIFNRLLIAGNQVLSPAQSTEATVVNEYRSAGVISGTVNDTTFVDNMLYDDRGTHRCVYMFVCLSSMTAATNFRFMGGNVVRYADGVTPAVPIIPSSAAGCAPFVQEVVQTWPGTPANNFLVGSNIRVASSGNFYMQGTGPSGTAWNLGAFNNLPTTTTAPAAGGAGALPATPAGYVTFYFNGAARQLPYY